MGMGMGMGMGKRRQRTCCPVEWAYGFSILRVFRGPGIRKGKKRKGKKGMCGFPEPDGLRKPLAPPFPAPAGIPGMTGSLGAGRDLTGLPPQCGPL